MAYSQIIALPGWLCYGNAVIKQKMPSLQSDEDIQLMLSVAHGDERALRKLIDKWQSPLINFIYRSTHSFEEAEDIAQTVFVKLYKAAARYKPTAKFSTYLFHIARRQIINYHRSKKRKPMDYVDPADLHSHSTEDNVNYSELEEAFYNALKTLPEKQKTAMLLLKQQGLSYSEIAESMKTSVSSIKSWIFRARQTLKEELKDFYTTNTS